MILSGRNISVVNAYFFARLKMSLSTSFVVDEAGAETADSDVDSIADAVCDIDDTLDNDV